MAGTNPFFHRRPVREPTAFFGRGSELATLAELLRQGQSVAIHGPRRIGKTSVLFQLPQPQLGLRYGLLPQTTCWAYLDGGQIDGLSEEWLYGAIDRSLGGESDAMSYMAFLARLRELANQGKRLIVAVDEFELLAANPNLGLSCFNRLRALTAQFPLQFVVASRDALIDLTYAHPTTLSSPFFNIFAPHLLGLLQPHEANELLASLSQHAGCAFLPETITQIIALVGSHPFFLQIAGYRFFTALVEQSTTASFSEQQYKHMQQQISADIAPHLRYAWGLLTTEEQYQLATVPVQDQLQHAIAQRLTQVGWLADTRYLGTLIEQFVRQQTISGVLHHGEVILDERRGIAATSQGAVHLTPSEYAALHYFLAHPDQIITLEQLEAALWPHDAAGDPERARGVLKKLRAALGAAGDSIVNRRGQGWLLQS